MNRPRAAGESMHLIFRLSGFLTQFFLILASALFFSLLFYPRPIHSKRKGWKLNHHAMCSCVFLRSSQLMTAPNKERRDRETWHKSFHWVNTHSLFLDEQVTKHSDCVRWADWLPPLGILLNAVLLKSVTPRERAGKRTAKKG